MGNCINCNREISDRAKTCPRCGEPDPARLPYDSSDEPPAFPKEQNDKKFISSILAIFLGWIGAHKFFLGYTLEGVIMLACGLGGFFLCGIPTVAVFVIGFIEGMLYLTKTDNQFVRAYVVGRKGWF